MLRIPREFTLDACGTERTTQVRNNWYTPEEAMVKPWDSEFVFLNPPQSRAKEDRLDVWCERAYAESKEPYNSEIWMLLPASPDTTYFHYLADKGLIWFLKGRVHFLEGSGQLGSPRFASMLVILGDHIEPNMVPWDWKKAVKRKT